MNKEITVSEAAKKRNILENRITNLIQNFFAETGVGIRNVQVETKTMLTIDGNFVCQAATKISLEM